MASVNVGAELISACDHRTEALLVLARGDESADHPTEIVGLDVVQHTQPEVISCPDLDAKTKVLHQNERGVVLSRFELRDLNQIQQHLGGYPLAYYHLAQAFDRKGDHDRARTSYERFLQIWREADADLPQVVAARNYLALHS